MRQPPLTDNLQPACVCLIKLILKSYKKSFRTLFCNKKQIKGSVKAVYLVNEADVLKESTEVTVGPVPNMIEYRTLKL